MAFFEVKKPTLEDLESELLNVQKSKKETEKFLNSLDSLKSPEIAEIKKLERNLNLLKSFEKKENKQKFIQILDKRELKLNKIIKIMKKKGLKAYDPREVKWTSN